MVVVGGCVAVLITIFDGIVFWSINESSRLPAHFSRVHEAAHTPAGVVTRQDDPTLTRARATVLAQAIHHATEHRAQIAGALVANGVTALSLDDLAVWAFGDAEGLGA